MISAQLTVQVPFHDIDPMEIVWHGHYVKYFELARCALLDKIGYNYPQMRDSQYAWPIIELHVKYVKPATFGRLICINVELVEYEFRLKMRYLITDVATGNKLTKGTTTQVAVCMKSNEMCMSSPSVLIEKIKRLL